MTKHVALVILMMSGADTAAADVCVEVDRQRDALTASDREIARSLLVGAVEAEGHATVVDWGCATGYLVYHSRSERGVRVSLTGPNGASVAETARGFVELPVVYRNLVTALLTGTPNRVSSEEESSPEVDVQPVRPNIWYGRLGPASIVGGNGSSGFAMGLGFRKEWGHASIDLAIGRLVAPNLSGGSHVRGSLEGLYLVNPTGTHTAYVGGGLGLSETMYSYEATEFRNSGIEGVLTAGYTIWRDRRFRGFAQVDVGLPLYMVSSGQATRYAPMVSVSVGGGLSY